MNKILREEKSNLYDKKLESDKNIITFFTPTYNRAKFLPRVYNSLKNQTSDKFVWIIVNDGSTDNTDDVVTDFIKKNELPIFYIKKENGGKHSAFEVALNECQTEYFQAMDDDDIYDKEVVEFYLKEWAKVKEEEREDIGAIRTIARRQDGSLVTNKPELIPECGWEDISTLEMKYIKNHIQENWTSYKTRALREIDLFPHGYWLEENHKFFTEGIWQDRFARKFKCRYIYKSFRIYSEDAAGSLIRTKKNKQYYIDSFINHKFFLEQDFDWIKKNPKSLIIRILSLQLIRGYLEIYMNDLIKNTSSKFLKTIFFFTSPVSLLGKAYIKNRSKRISSSEKFYFNKK